MQFDTVHREYKAVKEAYEWFIQADRDWSPDYKRAGSGTATQRLLYYDARKRLVDEIFETMKPPKVLSVPIVGTSRRNRRQRRDQEQAANAPLIPPIYPVRFMQDAVNALDVPGLHWSNTRFYMQPATAREPGRDYDPEVLNMYVKETGLRQGCLHVFYNTNDYSVPMGHHHSHAILVVGRGSNDTWSVDSVARHHQRSKGSSMVRAIVR